MQLQNQTTQINQLQSQQSSSNDKRRKVVVSSQNFDDDDNDDDDDDDDNNGDGTGFRKLSSLDRNASIADTGMDEKEFRHIFAHLAALNPDGCLAEEHSILSVAEVAKENIAAKKTLGNRNVSLDKRLKSNLAVITIDKP